MPADSPESDLADRDARARRHRLAVSRDEAQLYHYVKRHRRRCRSSTTTASRSSTPPRAARPLVLLAGHTDTVPVDGNVPGRIEDGAVHGRGASDMKGGLAVMIELGRWAAAGRARLRPRAALLPARGARAGRRTRCRRVFEAAPLVDEAALVICLEPTDNTLQLGCLGNINARVVFEGRSAHSARPWLGVNAIALALEGLRPVLELQPLDVDVDGLVFREVVSVTQIDDCGNATNVIPGRVEATLNFRYAPTAHAGGGRGAPARARRPRRSRSSSTRRRRRSRSARRSSQRLRDVGGFEVQPKQAWTNVADFAARGLDALNFGPGATRYAHTADEQVEIAELARTLRGAAAVPRRVASADAALAAPRGARAVPVRAARRLARRRARAAGST